MEFTLEPMMNNVYVFFTFLMVPLVCEMLENAEKRLIQGHS